MRGAVLTTLFACSVFIALSFVALNRPLPVDRPLNAFVPGQTWEYQVRENFTSMYEDKSRSGTSTLHVLRTNLTTSAGWASLVSHDGSFLSALLGPRGSFDDSEPGYLVVDPDGWEWIGSGYLDRPFSQADIRFVPLPPPTPDPCDGQILFAEQRTSPHVHLAPQRVLDGGTWNGTWNFAGGNWDFRFEHLESAPRFWKGVEYAASHLRLTLDSHDGIRHTETRYWYLPALDAVLEASRRSVRDDGASWYEVTAELDLVSYEVRDVQSPPVVERGDAIPVLPELDIRSHDPAPAILGAGAVVRSFDLVRHDGSEWIPDPSRMGVTWSLIWNRTVVASASGPKATFALDAPGHYYLSVQIYTKRCILDPSWTSIDAPTDLGSLHGFVPTIWKRNWTINVDPGISREILLDEFTLDSTVSMVTSSARWLGSPGASPTDAWSVLFRTPANNDITPSPSLPPGDYRLIWKAQGANGGPVVGDDWELTVQIRYG